MPNIMASAARAACVLAGTLAATTVSAAADDAPNSAYSPLPGSYSLSYEKDRWTDEYSVFHLAVSEDFGVVGSGFAASVDPRLKPLTRLDSAWTVNSSWLPVPLRLGDGVSSVNLWSAPVRMGGIQLGSFQPTPPEVVAPPSLLATPYVMGPTGLAPTRFIDRLHSLPQFEQPSLAADGQSDYSLETGRLRENFEVRSDGYGPWLTSGTYRYGVSGITTIDGSAASLAHQQSYVGVGVLQSAGPGGLVAARVAGSHDPAASGWLALLGANFNHDPIHIAVRTNVQSPGFQDVGDVATSESLRQRSLATAGVDLGFFGRLSLAGAAETYVDATRRNIVALSHALYVGAGGILSTAAAYSPGPYGAAALTLSFMYPFGYFGGSAIRIDHAIANTLDRAMIDSFEPGLSSYREVSFLRNSK